MTTNLETLTTCPAWCARDIEVDHATLHDSGNHLHGAAMAWASVELRQDGTEAVPLVSALVEPSGAGTQTVFHLTFQQARDLTDALTSVMGNIDAHQHQPAASEFTTLELARAALALGLVPETRVARAGEADTELSRIENTTHDA